MKKYDILHDRVSKNLFNKLEGKNSKVKEISNRNKSNFILSIYTFFGSIFLMGIFLIFHKINIFQFFEGNLLLLKIIFLFIAILYFFTIVVYGYIFYFVNLYKILFLNININIDIIYKWKILLSIIILNSIIIICFILSNNVNIISDIFEKYGFYISNGYLLILLISFFFFVVEFFIKNHNIFSLFVVYFILTILPFKFSYFLTSVNIKKLIKETKSKEFTDIKPYLIFGNILENRIKFLFILVSIIGFVGSLLNIHINETFFISVFKENYGIIIYISILTILLFFFYKIFFTPSFIRNYYYICLKENNKIDT